MIRISEIPPPPLLRGSSSVFKKVFFNSGVSFPPLRESFYVFKKVFFNGSIRIPLLMGDFSVFKNTFFNSSLRFPVLRGSFSVFKKVFFNSGISFPLLMGSSFVFKKAFFNSSMRIPLLKESFSVFKKVFFNRGMKFPVLRESFFVFKTTFFNSSKRFPLLSESFIFFKKMFFNGSMRFPLLKGVGGLLVLVIITNVSYAQEDTLNPKRLKTVVATESIGYVGAMSGMYALWYKDVPSSSFHVFNDNKEWLQMDKVGHGVTSYYVGMAGYHALKWSGVNKKKSIWFGGTLGLFFLTSVEVYDGYSADWGFSWGDVGVNVAGSAMFIAQQLAWDEQRILLKYSFHKTSYSDINPNLLGNNLLQNVIKDYNGQTYWASINVASFLNEATKFPKWLNIAVGYGAEGMIGAFENPSYFLDQRERQYYLSLDIDLTRIKTKSKFANTVLGAFGFIKFPLPTLEFNQRSGTRFYGVYF